MLHLPDRLGCFTHTRSGALLLGFAKYLAVLKRFDTQAVGEHTLGAEGLAGGLPGRGRHAQHPRQ